MRFVTKVAQALVLCLVGTAVVLASPVEKEQKTIERTDETNLKVKLEFGAGTIEMNRGSADKILDAHVTYEPKYIDYYIDYDKRGSTGHLDMSGEYIHESHFDTDIKNDWKVKLTDAVPMDLKMKLGAADADVDFTGLQVSDLDLDIGAADARLWWDERNPVSLGHLTINCGASSFKMDGLGNANFENMSFDGGVGSFELDFTGDWQQSAQADLDVGLGSLDIVLPRDIGVRIKTDDSFFSSVDVDRRFHEVDDDLYESDNYDTAKIHLDIRLSIGMGSVDIRSARR